MIKAMFFGTALTTIIKKTENRKWMKRSNKSYLIGWEIRKAKKVFLKVRKIHPRKYRSLYNLTTCFRNEVVEEDRDKSWDIKLVPTNRTKK